MNPLNNFFLPRNNIPTAIPLVSPNTSSSFDQLLQQSADTQVINNDLQGKRSNQYNYDSSLQAISQQLIPPEGLWSSSGPATPKPSLRLVKAVEESSNSKESSSTSFDQPVALTCVLCYWPCCCFASNICCHCIVNMYPLSNGMQRSFSANGSEIRLPDQHFTDISELQPSHKAESITPSSRNEQEKIQCTYPGCTKKVLPHNLKKHLTTHGERKKEFKCQFIDCNKSYFHDRSLKRHYGSNHA